jgi:hypothetical protein
VRLFGSVSSRRAGDPVSPLLYFAPALIKKSIEELPRQMVELCACGKWGMG